MHESKSPTVCLTDEIMAKILGTIPYIIFKKDDAGEFRRKCL